MAKKLLKLAGIGFLIGIAVSTFITSLAADPYPVSQKLIDSVGGIRAALLLQNLLAGAYGAVCMCGVALYDAERLPLAAATFLHCLLVIVPYYPLSLFLGWNDGLAGLLITSCAQLAAFFGIWLVLYLRYRKEIRELNRMQKQMLDQSEQEENK